MVNVVNPVNEIQEDEALEDGVLEVEASRKRKVKEDLEGALTIKRLRLKA